jgi:hypothetical protein
MEIKFEVRQESQTTKQNKGRPALGLKAKQMHPRVNHQGLSSDITSAFQQPHYCIRYRLRSGCGLQWNIFDETLPQFLVWYLP